MEKIVMIIEKSRNHYGAYAENGDGIYAAGNTIEEVQADTEQASAGQGHQPLDQLVSAAVNFLPGIQPDGNTPPRFRR